MKIYFEEFIDEIDELIEFLTSDTWQFHGTPNPNPEIIRKSYENNYYRSDDSKTFWIIKDDVKVGMMRVFDLEDGTPLFDIRIASKYKGLGIGTIAVNYLLEYVFNNYQDKNRVEAFTRQDNYAMRTVLNKCNFLKEAHHRKSWSGSDGIIYDAVGYGITKEDWQAGIKTPFVWDDFKY